MASEHKNLNYAQKTFGASNDWRMKKTRIIATQAEGTLVLKAFEEQRNKMALIVSLFPEIVPKGSARVLKILKNVIISHGECPDDANFWEWYVSTRNGRVATIHNEFRIIFQYLQIGGYYSKTYLPMLLNFRLKQRDGVRKGDVILNEEEIACVARKVYPLNTVENRGKQRALDTFVLSLFTAARVADVRYIVKSMDEVGNPILMYHNHKGTRTQTVAWNEAVEGALERGLYKKQTGNSFMYASLKVALFEALPTSSNRLINYYYLRPGKGRELKTDARIAHITFHTARHTFCTRLLKIGVSPAIVARLAGHKSIQTTMRYYNWMLESEANDILRMVYKSNSVINNKTYWGEGASSVQPLPQIVFKEQLQKPKYGPVIEGDSGLTAKMIAAKAQRKPSAKRLAWLEKCKKLGVI